MKNGPCHLNLACIALPLLAVLLMMMMTGCGTTMKFGLSTIVPAAEGKVSIHSDQNNNNSLMVRVDHLAPPDRLTPPHSAYVVWMETRDNLTKNIGLLKSTSGTFSNALKATLKTVTPFEPRAFFITAEHDPATLSPGPLVVLRTN